LLDSKEEVNIKKLYGEDAISSKEDILKKYSVHENGLSAEEVDIKLRNLGPNEIKNSKSKKWYNYFLESLFSPFNSILLGIVIILIYTDIYLPEKPSYANIIVIAVLVTASTLLDFFEEYRSNKAAEKLKELVATTATVIRNGKEEQVPISTVTLRRYCFTFRRFYDTR